MIWPTRTALRHLLWDILSLPDAIYDSIDPTGCAEPYDDRDLPPGCAFDGVDVANQTAPAHVAISDGLRLLTGGVYGALRLARPVREMAISGSQLPFHLLLQLSHQSF